MQATEWLYMAVQTKQIPPDDNKLKADPGSNGQGKGQAEPVGTRGGKEHDTVYQQEEKLLNEVKEKYKEADSAVEKQLVDAIGTEAKIKAKANIPPDVSGFGVKSPDDEASEVFKKDGTLVINTTEEELARDLKTDVGGKRTINKTIVGAKSVLAWALRLSRIVKTAHKHAKRVIFGKSRSEEVDSNADRGGR